MKHESDIKTLNRTRNIVSSLFDNTLISAIREGFLYMMPLIIIGAFVVAFLNLPIPQFQEFMLNQFGEGWKDFPLIVHNATLQIASLTAVIAISYALATHEESVKDGYIKEIYVVLTAFASYVAFIKPSAIAESAISVEAASAGSMFSALIISIISVKLLMLFYKHYDKHFPSMAHKYNGNVVVRTSFHLILPCLGVILVFAIANMLIHVLGIIDGVTNLLEGGFKMLFMSDNVISVVLIVLATQLLWFVGIHGGNVFMEALGEASEEMATQGLAVGSFSKEVFDVFVYYGGAGATLALILALLIFGEKATDKKLARSAIFPGLLNINEPIIYGLPIIFNPFFFIPFLAAPVVVALISYIAVSTGIVPLPVNEINWTTPIFISGYVSTGSWSAVILQAICFVVAFAIYVPFVKLSKENSEEKYKKDFENLTREMRYIQDSKARKIITRSDEIGSVARFLASEINDAVNNNKDLLHLEYQPKVDAQGRVLGAEALLRWNHEMFGYVSPITILSIADEAELNNELGRWIIKTSMEAQKTWIDEGYKDVSLSVNLSPMQLNTDHDLMEFIEEQIEKNSLDPDKLEFELTENATIEQTDEIFGTLKQIREMGSDISIDDFGMGHSSLKYLYDFFANVVKLDASLVQAVPKGEDRQQIVKAILDLCKRLDVRVVAEGVETKEQLDIMNELGADYYQGWYFSKALPNERLIEYIKKKGTVIH